MRDSGKRDSVKSFRSAEKIFPVFIYLENMAAVQAVKKEVGNDLSATRELTSQAAKKIYAELTKGQKKLHRKISAEQIGEAVAQSVSHLPGIDTETVKQMFLAMTGTVTNHEKRPDDQ